MRNNPPLGLWRSARLLMALSCVFLGASFLRAAGTTAVFPAPPPGGMKNDPVTTAIAELGNADALSEQKGASAAAWSAYAPSIGLAYSGLTYEGISPAFTYLYPDVGASWNVVWKNNSGAPVNVIAYTWAADFNASVPAYSWSSKVVTVQPGGQYLAAGYEKPENNGAGYELNSIGPLAPQTVSLSPSSASAYVGGTLTFNASAADNNGNNITNSNGGYVWTDSAGSGASQAYQFPAAGNYAISVWSPGNATYAVSNIATATVAVSLCPQTVSLAASSSSTLPDTPITFTASAVKGDGSAADITFSNGGYSWSVSPGVGVSGGGGPANAATYVFANPGVYAVSVSSPGNSTYATSNTATALETVHVLLPQTITLSPSGVTVVRPASGSANSKTLTASGSQSGQAYAWSISPSGSGISVNPSGPNNNQAVANFTSSSPLGHYTVTATSPAGNGYLSGSASATVDFVSASSGDSIGARATAKSGYQNWFGPSNSVNTNIVLP